MRKTRTTRRRPGTKQSRFQLPRNWNDIKKHITKKRLFIAGGIFALFLILTPILTYLYFARDIGDRERLMNRNSTGVVLLDKDGEVFYSFGRVNTTEDVDLGEIADPLEQALIASEDQEFYEHGGFSVRGTLRALYGNILNKDLTRYGGSTLTQQLVKNNLLSADKNFLRKYQEVAMAIAIERQYTKDQILEMYLNSVYFGEGAFGVNMAAETYFGKEPSELTLAESAMLIGLLPAPSAYSPVTGDAELAKQQQEKVLSRMVEAGYIKEEQKTAALKAKLSYAESDGGNLAHAPHFAMMVLEELNEKYGEETVTRSGYQVMTGLDLDWQKQAESFVSERINQISAQGGRNASLVAIDPKTGEVRAMVGSADWGNQSFGKVNMATSPRQPGSSFKPIHFAEAIDQKLITPATILKDEPRTFGTYRPQNYDFRFLGDITARRALALSRNLPAIEVVEKLGINETVAAAQRLGISTINEPDKYGLTIALGTAEATVLDMTNAYAAFANGGIQHEPVIITSIKDKYDREIFEHDRNSDRVMGAEASFLISSILADNTARSPAFGSSLSVPGRQVAVKTGTTNDNKDAWTIGYSPQVSVGVWVGNNESQPMTGVAGGSGAGPIWRNSIMSFLEGMPAEEFEVPAGVVQLRICSVNGLRAEQEGENTYSEYFIRGTEPTGVCEQAKPEDKEKKKDEKEKEKEEKPDEENEGDGGDNPDEEPIDPQEPDTGTEEGTEENGGQGGEGPGGGTPPDDSTNQTGTSGTTA